MSNNLQQSIRKPPGILLDSRSSRLALIPVPLLLLIIVFLWAADLRTPYDNPILLLALNLLFLTLTALLVVFLIGWSFLRSGETGLLMLGCGVFFWGFAGTIASVVLNLEINAAVTIHNSLACLAAFCHFLGVIFSQKWKRPVRSPALALAIAFAMSLSIVVMTIIMTMQNLTPIFFVQGEGGTQLRQIILGLSIILFGLSALVLWQTNRQKPSAFLRWYGAALLLLMTGLLGVMLQPSVGGLLGWAGRISQQLSGVYMLIAAIASVREKGSLGISLSEALRESEERFQLFMDNSPSIAWMKDEEGRIVYTSKSYEQRFGITPDTWLGKTDFELWPQEIAQVFRDNDLAVLRDGQTRQVIEEARNADGSSSFWLNSKFILQDAAGRKYVAGSGVDITKLREAEKSLHQSEERYRALVENSPDLITRFDRDLRMIYANPAVLLRIGKTMDELVGRTALEYGANSSSAKLWDQKGRKVLETGEAQRFETITTWQGQERIYDLMLIPEHGTDGAVSSIMNVARDITELKNAERAQRENEERLNLVLQANSIGVFEFDLQTGKGQWNAMEFELLGLKPDDAIPGPETFFQYVHPEDAGLLRAHWEEALRSGTLDAEFRVIRADGKMRWLAGKGQFISDGKQGRGAPEAGSQGLLYMGVNYDITERKHAEADLRQSEARLKLAQSAAGAGTWDWDIPTGTLDWAEELFKLFGLDPLKSRATFDYWRSVMHPDDRSLAEQRIEDAIRYHTPLASEYRIVLPTGQVRWINALGQASYDLGGLPLRMSGICIDITERKQAEEALKTAYEEMEVRVEERTADLKKLNDTLNRTNKALEDFSHVASHDLQEPLRKIITFSERLIHSDLGSSDVQARDHLTRMQKAAARMQTLIQDLAKYSRVTSSPDHFKVINLKRSAEEAVTDLTLLIEEIEGRVEIGELPNVRANEIQMRHLFQNIIGNALKYRSARPPIIKIYNNTSSQDRFNEIHIEDNGIGFDEMHLDKIFKPLQRLHGKSSPYEGTGMGLAICQKILEFHGGSITAKSEPGKGSTFIVRLPKMP
jgi:PAS domain S-box-containing protein